MTEITVRAKSGFGDILHRTKENRSTENEILGEADYSALRIACLAFVSMDTGASVLLMRESFSVAFGDARNFANASWPDLS